MRFYTRSREISLIIAVVVKPWITHYSLYPMVLTKYFSLFWLSISRLKKKKFFILIKHFSFEKHFLFSQCGCLRCPNYFNLHWKWYFSKNLHDAKFKNILSLGYCGLSGDTKMTKFFSHNFSRYNSEKLIRTLILFILL